MGTRANPKGVDLMRNAPVDSMERVPWLVGGQRISPRLPWYRGQEDDPMEPESQALCEVVRRDLLTRRFGVSVDCHSGFGMALKALGRPDEAVDSFRRAMQLDPESADIHSNLLFSLLYRRAEDRQALFEEHLEWGRRHSRGLGWQAARTAAERRLPGRLKIGYLSPDFRWHPVAHFIEPVLAAHDRDKVAIFCYSDVPQPDADPSSAAAVAAGRLRCRRGDSLGRALEMAGGVRRAGGAWTAD